MNYVTDKGWDFYWGTSEWSAQQITEAWGVAQRLDLVGPIAAQPEYNLLSRHKVSFWTMVLDFDCLTLYYVMDLPLL
ncbi:putative voltage-gated potassium channel subunit beta [Capsicum baccatum]|uniref:Voltage-gated potassium channel subunit beta n=1 Tax=Capsicum baccatum TaxID=33114 RepID=A0A2G2W4V7_CAPBA|nr:putative voltage-gated potassium channel subunit beta [Capsicum baccatum]